MEAGVGGVNEKIGAAVDFVTSLGPKEKGNDVTGAFKDFGSPSSDDLGSEAGGVNADGALPFAASNPEGFSKSVLDSRGGWIGASALACITGVGTAD